MDFKILSIQEHQSLKEQVVTYCEENCNSVFKSFVVCLEESIQTQDCLPKTYVLLLNDTIIGFYQLSRTECITKQYIYPWFKNLYIGEIYRCKGLGKLLLEHGRKTVGSLGFDKIYLATDFIGYYEKYGFREIGLDKFEWGKPIKIYEHDALTDIRLEVFHSLKDEDDKLLSKIAQFKWNTCEKDILTKVFFMKLNHFGESTNAKWFEIIAFNQEESVIGFIFFMRHPTNPNQWYLGDLSVAKEYERKGIATKLIRKGLDLIKIAANNCGSVYSYIEKDNVASIKLHEKLGFVNTNQLLPFLDLYWSENQTTFEYHF